MNLHISNLGDHITDESLRAVFATYGYVSDTKIVRGPRGEQSGTFALIDMPDLSQAIVAINKLNGSVINGKCVCVRVLLNG